MPDRAGGAGARPRWVTAFVDVPAPCWEPARRFWSDLTGWRSSPVRGDREEFVSLLPGDGTDLLRAQRLGDGPARIHLDLHVGDRVEAARRDALALGAHDVGAGDGYRVLRSPGGFVWCLVPGPPETRVPAVAVRPAGHRSRLAQVCIDVPRTAFEAETGFWAALLGVRPEPFAAMADAVALPAPTAAWPLRVILQRLGHGDAGGPDGTGGGVRAHLEWWTDDVAAEVRRHVDAGARPLAPGDSWQVLSDPAGLPYCVIDRDPVTGADR